MIQATVLKNQLLIFSRCHSRVSYKAASSWKCKWYKVILSHFSERGMWHVMKSDEVEMNNNSNNVNFIY